MIRQALECFADPTLEPMLNDDGVTLSDGSEDGSVGLASGWGGTPHVCRDIKALTEWVDAAEQHPLLSVESAVHGEKGSAHSSHGGNAHGAYDHQHGEAKPSHEGHDHSG